MVPRQAARDHLGVARRVGQHLRRPLPSHRNTTPADKAYKSDGRTSLGNDGDDANRTACVQAESNATSETVETTKAQGLKFLDSLKQAKDKTYVPALCH
jgi:hypothetical protein